MNYHHVNINIINKFNFILDKPELMLILYVMEKLDLHRTRHSEVKRRVVHFIEDNWGSSKEVEIVTGNSDKMRSLVTNILDEYRLLYSIGRIFDHNRGYLVVLME